MDTFSGKPHFIAIILTHGGAYFLLQLVSVPSKVCFHLYEYTAREKIAFWLSTG